MELLCTYAYFTSGLSNTHPIMPCFLYMDPLTSLAMSYER
jgi:hypothetical protein